MLRLKDPGGVRLVATERGWKPHVLSRMFFSMSRIISFRDRPVRSPLKLTAQNESESTRPRKRASAAVETALSMTALSSAAFPGQS